MTFDLELQTREGHMSCESSSRLDLDLSDSERVLLDSSCEPNANDDVENVELERSQLGVDRLSDLPDADEDDGREVGFEVDTRDRRGGSGGSEGVDG